MNNYKVRTVAECINNGEQPDILFWVGSAGSFDDRAKKISQAFVKILNAANINFAVLGEEESSSGDAAKRAGNEFLFQMQALMNIEVLNSYNINNIVTTCPHSYNTLKNEYSGLGGNYNVLHHTEFISNLIDEKKIILKSKIDYKKLTYHDPCYLGRGNDIYDAPRKLIDFLDLDFVEIPRNKRNSFCCGAGGAQMFKESENGEFEINIVRTKEALETNADIIATGCPFCNTMMTDGVKNLEEGKAEVMDLAELIASCL